VVDTVTAPGPSHGSLIQAVDVSQWPLANAGTVPRRSRRVRSLRMRMTGLGYRARLDDSVRGLGFETSPPIPVSLPYCSTLTGRRSRSAIRATSVAGSSSRIRLTAPPALLTFSTIYT
jgi:hypothetical protein